MHGFSRKGRLFSLIWIVLGFWTSVQAQRNPYRVDNFPPAEYASAASFSVSNSNWDIIQDASGIIYVGNNTCMLTFDGREWRTVKGSRNLQRAQFTNRNGEEMFWGSNGDLGYLDTTMNGEKLKPFR